MGQPSLVGHVRIGRRSYRKGFASRSAFIVIPRFMVPASEATVVWSKNTLPYRFDSPGYFDGDATWTESEDVRLLRLQLNTFARSVRGEFA